MKEINIFRSSLSLCLCSLQWFNWQNIEKLPRREREIKANVEWIIYASFYVLSIFRYWIWWCFGNLSRQVKCFWLFKRFLVKPASTYFDIISILRALWFAAFGPVTLQQYFRNTLFVAFMKPTLNWHVVFLGRLLWAFARRSSFTNWSNELVPVISRFAH